MSVKDTKARRLSVRMVALLWMLTLSIWGCTSVQSGLIKVNIISATVDGSGFCCATIVVTNSCTCDFPLLVWQGVYPELDVRVYDDEDKAEKQMMRFGLNCVWDSDNLDVVRIRPHASVQLRVAFTIQNYTEGESLIISVALPDDRSRQIQKAIVNISGSSVGKGLIPYPRLDNEDIQGFKVLSRVSAAEIAEALEIKSRPL